MVGGNYGPEQNQKFQRKVGAMDQNITGSFKEKWELGTRTKPEVSKNGGN